MIQKKINANPYYVFHIIPRNSILRKIVDVCVLTRAYNFPRPRYYQFEAQQQQSNHNKSRRDDRRRMSHIARTLLAFRRDKLSVSTPRSITRHPCIRASVSLRGALLHHRPG